MTDPAFYFPPAAADLLGVSVQTLANWRSKNSGPRYVKVGGRVRYRVSDVQAWLEVHAVTPTH